MTGQTIQIALLGYTAHVRPFLESLGDVKVDCFWDGAGVALDISCHRRSYDLVVVHAPYGEGFPPLTFRYGNHERCPVYMINDPPGCTAKIEVKLLLDRIRRDNARFCTEQAVTIESGNRED